MSTSHKLRPVAVVIGCDDIGSAIAWTLHRAGLAVVLVDAADPPWARRGMSYTDAWYVGGATLEQVDACFCTSVRSVPTVLARGDMIAATTWSWEGVVTALHATVVVETRPGGSRTVAGVRPAMLEDVLAIGVRTTRVGEWRADVVIADACEPDIGLRRMTGARVARSAAADVRHDTAGNVAAYARLAIHRIDAPHGGCFRTRREIGERVAVGDTLGEVGSFTAFASYAGVLRGLTARGARVAAGETLVEIDPLGEASYCFGIAAEPRAIAYRVTAAVRRAKQRSTSPAIARSDGDERLPLAAPRVLARALAKS